MCECVVRGCANGVGVCGGGSDSAVCLPAGVDGRYIYSNQLSGSIPVELGRLTALTYLYDAHLIPPCFSL